MNAVDENELKLKMNFAGPNGHYYEDKWNQLEESNQKVAVNFAAFFFSILWLGYRKMYAMTALIALGYLIVNGIIYFITLRYDLPLYRRLYN